jgi:hypothetical protein
MASDILLYVGSAIIFLWGLAHIAVTRSVVEGFGTLSADNRHILTMEWVAEGLAFWFIGALVLLVRLGGGCGTPAANLVYRASAGMLLVMAVWSGLTGARTSILPMKLCPVVKTVVAALYLVASWL